MEWSVDESTGRTTQLTTLQAWLPVIAEPNRLRILALLLQGEQCSCELGDCLGMAPSLLSHHLAVLQRAGLVSAARDHEDARWIHYAVDPAALDRLRAAFVGLFGPPAAGAPRPAACPRPGLRVRPALEEAARLATR